MEFVNRQREMERLNALMASKEGGLAVVWGRRRVGKTRLLLEWVNRWNGVYYTADESAKEVQRRYFALALDSLFPGFSEVEYPDWSSFFSRLAKEAKISGKKGPFVIDELPYLISASPELPALLQKFIDIEAKEARLVLVFCGSSQKMMEGAVLEASAPLYGRAAELLKLRPILAGYMQKALYLESARETVESYALWGGIPRYWELFERATGDWIDKVEKIVLDPMGPLHDEPLRLLSEEVPSAVSLRPILDVIGLGWRRSSEIGGRIGLAATSLSRPLSRLIELDWVEREVPLGESPFDSKRSLYSIKDPFLRFWFEVVAPHKSFFLRAPPSLRVEVLKKHLPLLISQSWEALCREASCALIAKFEGECVVEVGRFWSGKGPKWDCIARSRDKDFLWIGEAKWSSKPFSQQQVLAMIRELKNKGLPPLSRDAKTKIVYALFLPEKPEQLSLDCDVRVFSAEEVLSVLS